MSARPGGTQPVAYLGAHGVRDGVFNIATGWSLRDRFVRNNGCTAQNAPEPAKSSPTHTKTTYSGCPAGHPVVWLAFYEGHIAAPQDGATGDSGSRTWLPAETWNFFTQFQSTPPSTPPSSPPPGNGGHPDGLGEDHQRHDEPGPGQRRVRCFGVRPQAVGLQR